ncbi:MAG: ABC transporter ATP-binding protein [Pseudomonadota bacterium]
MSLEFSHIAHAYGAPGQSEHALEDVSFTAASGEITCLLGASGCGKSTLLNLAAGLLPLQQGRIALDGETLAEPGASPSPEARPVGLVFQDGALFPHMTLAKNIAFGLPGERHDEIEGWLERVGLAGLGTRYPHQLSGGQQQRAALARAMAPEPQVLLMDEPFASVDIVLRRSLRRECRMLLRERQATTILVTHDPDEALDIADRIAVMEAGRIIQFGTPQELYNAPQAASVGAIFGGAQIVRAQAKSGGYESAFGFWPGACVYGDGAGSVGEADAVDLLVQARALRLDPDRDGLSVRDVHPLGARSRVLLRHESGAELTAEVPQSAGDHIRPGMRYRVSPDPASVRAFAQRVAGAEE